MIKANGSIITRGVRQIAKADDISVCLPPGFRRCWLSVSENADSRLLPISRAVAEVLIAWGFAYQG